MTSPVKIEDFTARYAPYVTELQEFFESRSVPFGSPEEVGRFVRRLHEDHAFRDEMSSMVRAIIYRARDGLAPAELLDVILVAVGGDAAGRVQGPVRELLTFVEGVFRSRWHPVPEPGESAQAGQAEQSAPGLDQQPVLRPERQADAVVAGAPAGEAVVWTARPESAIFSRAHSITDSDLPLNGGEAVPTARRAEQAERVSGPVWTGTALQETYESEPASRRWLWSMGFGAMVLTFCAGLFLAQRTAVQEFQQRDVNTAASSPPAEARVSPASFGEPPASAQPAPQPAEEKAAAKSRGAERQLGRNERAQMPAPVIRNRLGREIGYTPVALGVSPAIMSGRLIYAPAASYPTIARLAHVEGKVVMEAVVARNGHVVHADVISGHRLLRGAALRAVRARRYRPYMVDGKPADVATILTVDFRLHR